ncbi:T9SS C-terminal target domain-containing protein, partial [candidate division KSB1 bacterium]
EAGFYVTPGYAWDVAVSGDYAYVADGGSGLRVVNITNPAAPFESGFYDTPGVAYGVAVSGNYAYVADESSGLWVVNVTNPAAPSGAGYYNTPGAAFGVAVSGNYAYVADWYSLRVVDITNPTVPTEVGFCSTPGYAHRVTVSGNYAYVADGGSGLRVVNITNPAAPFESGFYDTPGTANGVAVDGCRACVTDYVYFGIYDCSAAIGDTCVGDLSVTLVPNNPNFPGSQNVSACARIVPGLFTRIVVPVNNWTNIPTVTVEAGCVSEPSCVPAQGWNLALPWQYDANTTSFFTTIMRVGEGCCVTLSLDYVLPVELLSFSAVPGDAQVLLRWQTASETGCDHFEIERDGVFTHRISAAGDASGHNYSWIDHTVTNDQTYRYSLWSVETNGERSMLRETEATPRAQTTTVTEYALHGNYPNPFNPETEIVYDLPEAETVSLKVFDLMGREVAELINSTQTAGQHRILFNASALSSGMYICQMTTGDFTASHKMMLLR